MILAIACCYVLKGCLSDAVGGGLEESRSHTSLSDSGIADILGNNAHCLVLGVVLVIVVTF